MTPSHGERNAGEVRDDLDGSRADETVSFGLDGCHYEIDLSTSNAAELRASFLRYIIHARQVRSAARSDYEHNQAIRRWARENGYNITSRGRIPVVVVQAYTAARLAAQPQAAAE